MKMEWTWMRYSLSFSETGELQHRQLETAEAGQSLHRERREGEICLELNPAEMFGLQNFSWKWQSCWRCCKRISDPASDAVFLLIWANKRIKMQQAAGHDFQNEIYGRSPCKIQIILSVCLWILLSEMVGGIASILFEFCFNMTCLDMSRSCLKSTDFLLGRTLCLKKMICWVCFFRIEVYTVLGT